jgi:hypothetical protein
MDLLKEYSTNGMTIGHGQWTGSGVDETTLGTTIDDSQIQNLLKGDAWKQDGNRLCFVFTPPGVKVIFGTRAARRISRAITATSAMRPASTPFTTP